MAEEKINHGSGIYNDVVLSSRVRLARNIAGLPFPVRMNNVRKSEVYLRICSILAEEKMPLRFIDMTGIYPYEAVSLAERHLISPEFASGSDSRVLALSEDEKISIMLGEKDHIRIQGFSDGLDLMKAYEKADNIDNILSSRIKYAFDSRLGFLNQRPHDAGTGMRVSVMMHLPALSITGEMAKFSITASKLGFRIRGSYGDGASVKGDIFRISNHITMGISEEQAIENLKSTVLQIATKERRAAEELIKDINVRDRINRSAGLLKNAVLLTADEMMELLSRVRFGALYGAIEADADMINNLFISMQPATLDVLAGRKLSANEKDEIRAKTVKKIFIE